MRASRQKPESFWSPDISADVSDFAPGLLSIEQRPPSPLGRRVLHVFLLLFALMLGGSAIGRVDIVTAADGKLIPQTYLKIVQPSDSGIISEILVHEGQRVEKGQLLAKMDQGYSTADTRQLQAEIARRHLQIRRIDAELGIAAFKSQADDPVDLFADAQAQLKSHQQTYHEQIEQARAAINKAWSDLTANRTSQVRLEKSLPTLRAEERSYSELTREGYAPQMQLFDKQRTRIQAEQDLRNLQQEARSLAAGLDQQVQQLALVTSNYRQNLQNERVDATSELKKLEQEMAKQQHKNALEELRAPADGIIKDVNVHTIGAVTQPGTVLMSLVPDNVPLRAEVWIKNEDIGFIHKGQTVKLKFATYPFQRYGTLNGKVFEVAADATDSQQDSNNNTAADNNAANSTNHAYRTLIELDGQQLLHAGKNYPLSPGMVVTADIRLGDQTVLEYLLSPLRKAVTNAAHER